MTESPHSRLARALDRIPDDRIADVLLEAMSAEVTNRSGVREPDTRTRIQAATLVISYKVGRPHVSGGPSIQEEGKPEQLVDLLAGSPSIMAKVSEALLMAKSRLVENEAAAG